MTDKFAVTRMVSEREMSSVQQPLSRHFLQIEAEMVGRIARELHLADKQWHEWPTFHVVPDDNVWARAWRYVAEVEAS